MTTTTNTAPPPVTAVTPSWLATYITFLKSHEYLIALIVGAFLLFHFYDKGVNAWLTHEQLQSNKTAQQVIVDHTDNGQIQTQLAQLLSTVSQQQSAINKLITQRTVQTAQQKQTDAKLTPNELATRFQSLLKVGQADVTSLEPSGNLVFTPVAAKSNIDQLEDFTQCTQDRMDLKTELAGEQSLFAKQNDLLVGTQKELTDEKTNHIADVKTLNAKAKASWLHGFKWGVGVGAIGGEIIRVLIGKP